MEFLGWLRQITRDPWLEADRARTAAMDRAAERNRVAAATLPEMRLYCPFPPRHEITGSTWENDYWCDAHGFVNPIREDGAQLNGDGTACEVRIVRMRELPPELTE